MKLKLINHQIKNTLTMQFKMNLMMSIEKYKMNTRLAIG